MIEMQCWNFSRPLRIPVSGSNQSLMPESSNEINLSTGVDDLFEISNDCALFDFILYTVTVGLLVVLGVAGNTISFVVLTYGDGAGTRTGGHRSGFSTSAGGSATTSFLLRALAAADTAVLLAAVPLYVLPPVYPLTGYFGDYYRTYIVVLPFLWPIYLVPFTVSVFITVLVSVDRYFAVCRPFGSGTGRGSSRPGCVSCHGSLLTVSRVRPLVAALVLAAVVYNIPRFFEYHAVEECVGVNRTRVGFEIGDFGGHLLYRIVYANVLYFIVVHGGPLIALSFLNFRLVQALRQRDRRRLALKKCGVSVVGGVEVSNHEATTMMTSSASLMATGTRNSNGSSNHQRDVTLTLVGVICVFIVCQTPTLIDHVLWTAIDKDMRLCGGWHYFYTAVGDTLAVLNSSVNFGVYVLTSRRFRRGVLNALHCGRRLVSTKAGLVAAARGGHGGSNGRRHVDIGETTCMMETVVPVDVASGCDLAMEETVPTSQMSDKVGRLERSECRLHRWNVLLQRVSHLTNSRSSALSDKTLAITRSAASDELEDDVDGVMLDNGCLKIDLPTSQVNESGSSKASVEVLCTVVE